MFSPPNEPPHEMIDSTPLSNEQGGLVYLASASVIFHVDIFFIIYTLNKYLFPESCVLSWVWFALF